METIDDPRIIPVQLKEADPEPIGFHSRFFLCRVEVDQTGTIGVRCKTVPFGRYNW
jgi:hypothetical protein